MTVNEDDEEKGGAHGQWQYELLTDPKSLNKTQKYTTEVNFEILNIPDIFIEGGSRIIRRALLDKGYFGCNNIFLDRENTQARKNAPNGRIVFYSTIIHDWDVKPKRKKVQIDWKTKDRATGLMINSSTVIEVYARNYINPETYKEKICKYCDQKGHGPWSCPKIIDPNDNRFSATSARLAKDEVAKPAWTKAIPSKVTKNLGLGDWPPPAGGQFRPMPPHLPQHNYDEINDMAIIDDDTDRVAKAKEIVNKYKTNPATTNHQQLGVQNHHEVPMILSPTVMNEAKWRSANAGDFSFTPGHGVYEESEIDEEGDKKDYVINNINHSNWRLFRAKHVGIDTNQGTNHKGTCLWTNGCWNFGDDEKTVYKRNKARVTVDDLENIEWDCLVNNLRLNRYSLMDIFLSENAATLSKVFKSATKKSKIMEMLSIDYNNIGWADPEHKVNPNTATIKTRQHRNTDNEALAVCAILKAVRRGSALDVNQLVEESTDFITLVNVRKTRKTNK